LSFLLYQNLVTGNKPEQWALVAVAAGLVLLVGLLFGAFAILGLYVGTIFDASKKRPIYVIDRVVNLREPLENFDNRHYGSDDR